MPNDLDSKIYFADRKAAARELIDDLPVDSFSLRDVVVIAVSDGGVIIADIVAKEIGAQMDILLGEPIPAPKNKELAIAMVSETRELVMHKALVDSFGIDEDYIFSEATRIYDEKVLSDIYRYRHGESICPLKDKTVILVDECVETGITIMSAIKSMISQDARNVYVAAPVMDREVYENLMQVSDGVFCPHRIRDYISVEYYYDNFEKPTFEEIERIIEQYERKNNSHRE